MSMRVTNKSLMDNYLNNMQMNLRSLMKYQNQMATGKEINRPSDDPYRAVKSMNLESTLARNQQYKRNINDAQGWMDATDTCIQEMFDVLNRFKAQTTQADSAMNSQASLLSIAEEMAQNMQRVVQVGNTTFEGRYIFGGFATNEAPFEFDSTTNLMTIAPDPSGARDGKIVREIAASVEIPINITADDLMGASTGNSLGVTMQKIYNTVNPTNPKNQPTFIEPAPEGGLTASSTLSEQLDYAMKELERHFENMTSIVAKVGALENRLESALERNVSQTLSVAELLSKTEDIDYVEKITEYKSRQNTYDAALASGGKLLQMTLISYLK